MKFRAAVCFVLLSALILSVFTLNAAKNNSKDTAAGTSQAPVANSDFVIKDGVLVKYTGFGGDVKIPYGVITIGENAFSGCSKLTGITIPSSVTSIGDYAFYSCYNLSTVIIPGSVTSIGDSAFYGYYDNNRISKLANVVIPKSVTSIGADAFTGTSWLINYPNHFVITGNGILIYYKGFDINVSIPNGVKAIGAGAFQYCPNIISVVIPGSVTSIGEYAFCEDNGYEPSKLSSVIIPRSVTNIGKRAFFGTPWLENYPEDFVIVGDQILLKYKGSQESIKIPPEVTSIGEEAFSGCDNLSSIILSDKVKSLGNYAFNNCCKLAAIELPNSVESIGDYALESCSIKSINIPSSVSRIGEGAFCSCSSLTSITVPENVKAINDFTFSGCEKLKSVFIQNGVTKIGKEAFSYCIKLENVSIPDSVESIGENAFGSTNLANVLIPRSVKSIGDCAFISCLRMNQINVDDNSANYSSRNGVLFNKDKTMLIQYPIGKKGSYIIPDTVTIIGGSAFACCGNLSNIVIPDSVKIISDSAFSECSNLASIIIPRSVTRIGDYAFYGYYNGNRISKLTDVTIPESVTSIGNDAFMGTPWLENYPNKFVIIGDQFLYRYNGSEKKVVIPNGVKAIGNFAFSYMDIVSVKIPGSVKIIGDNAFCGCRKLTGISIPNSVNCIGDRAFESCDGLVRISIPDSVKSLGNNVFDFCSSLKSVIIPASVKSIGDWYPEYEMPYLKSSVCIICPAGSYAEAYAKSKDILYRINKPVTKTATANSEDFVVENGVLISYRGAGGNVVIPDGIKSIAARAFYRRDNLKSIYIPDGVASIGDYAFCNYGEEGITSRITNVRIPVSVTSIGIGAFHGTPWLESYPDDFVVVGDHILIAYNGSSKKISIPAGVKSIGAEAFGGLDNITSITVPGSVTRISEGAFSFCDNLVEVTIPGSVKHIEGTIFEESPKVAVLCPAGSYAESYAIKNKIPFSDIVF